MSVSNSEKSILAKLLASENIRIEHRKVPTAAFNLQDRALILPIWKEMSADLYDLLIGHEIGHGFDDQGSKYDGDGALQSWWTDEDRAAFEKRTKNLIDQYAELTPAQLDDSHKVNGELTIGENIGDLGGLSIAYKAYMNSLNGKEPELIDGYTGAQRLFLSWGQAWRGKGRDEIVIQRLATDPHSPNEFRCNQIVRNLDSFYEAFDVKPGDKLWLDESQRVTIW